MPQMPLSVESQDYPCRNLCVNHCKLASFVSGGAKMVKNGRFEIPSSSS